MKILIVSNDVIPDEDFMLNQQIINQQIIKTKIESLGLLEFFKSINSLKFTQIVVSISNKGNLDFIESIPNISYLKKYTNELSVNVKDVNSRELILSLTKVFPDDSSDLRSMYMRGGNIDVLHKVWRNRN